MLLKLRERKNKGLELVSRDFKENMGFQMVYESNKVVERQVGLSLEDGVNMGRVVIARSLGVNTGGDTGIPGEESSILGERGS